MAGNLEKLIQIKVTILVHNQSAETLQQTQARSFPVPNFIRIIWQSKTREPGNLKPSLSPAYFHHGNLQQKIPTIHPHYRYALHIPQ